MAMMPILFSMYGVIAVLALVLTIRERMQEHRQTLRSAALGTLACALWPLTTACLLLAMTFEGRGAPRG